MYIILTISYRLYQSSHWLSYEINHLFYNLVKLHYITSRIHDHRDFYCDFGRMPRFSAIAVILRHGRENQPRPTVCNLLISAFWTVADVYTRKLCCGRETARCRCKIRYVSKFTAASRGSRCGSMAFLLDRELILYPTHLVVLILVHTVRWYVFKGGPVTYCSRRSSTTLDALTHVNADGIVRQRVVM